MEGSAAESEGFAGEESEVEEGGASIDAEGVESADTDSTALIAWTMEGGIQNREEREMEVITAADGGMRGDGDEGGLRLRRRGRKRSGKVRTGSEGIRTGGLCAPPQASSDGIAQWSLFSVH